MATTFLKATKQVCFSSSRRTAAVPRRSSTTSPIVCSASVSDVDRRTVILAAPALGGLLAAPGCKAAYGDSANVFGKTTNRSGFIPYAGDSWAMLLPSKWNPSKEVEDPNQVIRYADNQDQTNHTLVIVKPTSKSSISDFGSPEDFAQEIRYLLGVQSWQGETVSEGGFASGSVASAALLGAATETDKKGKTYYKLEILSRTADGDEGGRHQLFKATVSNGKLYVLKVQAGDKRWFKGTDKECLGIINSFTVA